MIEQSSIIISLIFSRGKDTEIMISLLTKTTFLSEIIGALCATMIGQSPIIISQREIMISVYFLTKT